MKPEHICTISIEARRVLARFLSAILVLGVIAPLLLPMTAFASTRLAVISSDSDREMAGLLTAHLSKSSGIELIERDEIQRLAAEKRLQELAAQGSYQQAGSLLRADGLIILTRDSQSKQPMESARLVAVEPGVVIDTMSFPVSSDVGADAVSIETRFGPLLEKLASYQNKDAAAISLLGLKFEIDSQQARSIERQLNRLLADRLIHEKDIFVLERWRMEALAWEKSMAPQATAFWTGSYLLDGTIRYQDRALTLTIRLKNADGVVKEVQLSGSTDNLAAIADELTNKIKAELGSTAKPIAWNKAAEGANYVRLGEWALDNSFPADAISAIESAIALGVSGQKVETLQIKAYAMVAYPDDLRSNNSNYSPSIFDANKMMERVEAATEAVTLAHHYIPRYANIRDPSLNSLEHPYLVLMTGLRVLRAACEKQTYIEHPDEVARLRAAVRQLGGIHPKGTDNCLPITTENVIYAPYWTETPEETVKVYRKALSVPTSPDFTWGFPEHLRVEWSREPVHYPFLNSGDRAAINRPWLASWTPRAKQELPTIWQGFVNELKCSKRHQDQIDGLMLGYLSFSGDAARAALLPAICDSIWNYREEIFAREQPVKIVGLEKAIYQARSAKEAPESVKSLPLNLFSYLLRENLQTDAITVMNLFLAIRPPWTESEARLLLPLLNSYEIYLASLPKGANENRNRIAGIRNSILARYPSLAPPEEAKPGQVVANHFWSIFSQEAFQKMGINKDARFEQPKWRDGKLWFTISMHHQLCSVDPVTNEVFMTRWPETPDPKEQGFIRRCVSLEVTPEYAFVVVGCYVWKYHRASGQWSRIDLPLTDYKARAIGDKLFLLYQNPTDGNIKVGSGLLQLNPRDDSYEILISSRRTPPENFLDDKLGNH